MYSNAEFKDLLKKVRPDYVTQTSKGNDKWRESRVYWTVLYPESANGDIEKLASDFPAPSILSPCHDKDKKEDGSFKKAHYHFLTTYSGKKNPYQFYCDLVGTFGETCFSTVETVSDTGKAVRYLCHLDEDDPLKFCYPIEELKCFGGFECKKYLFEKVGDTMDNVDKLVVLIKYKNFLFYDELSDYLMENDPLLFASLVKDRNVKSFVREYLKGREHNLWYSGKVEKGYTKIRMENGTDKVIFNRELKGASSA